MFLHICSVRSCFKHCNVLNDKLLLCKLFLAWDLQKQLFHTLYFFVSYANNNNNNNNNDNNNMKNNNDNNNNNTNKWLYQKYSKQMFAFAKTRYKYLTM